MLVTLFVLSLAQDIRESTEDEWQPWHESPWESLSEWEPSKATTDILKKLIECKVEPTRNAFENALRGNLRLLREIQIILSTQRRILGEDLVREISKMDA